jgi:hypothetical protein
LISLSYQLASLSEKATQESSELVEASLDNELIELPYEDYGEGD